jgi:hypothetical protein
MNNRLRWVLAVFLAAFSAAGCQVSKSSNPLSPSVAGPIAGVTISTPYLLEPGMDWQIRMRDQPVKLMIQNADTSGVRPISYTFEIASDAAFASIVFKRAGVAPGTDGKTRLQLPDALPTGRDYWWRARAEDGANVGPYSSVVKFAAITPTDIGAPVLNSPVGVITTGTPQFTLTAGARTGPIERVVYQIQVANDPAFASVAATFSPDQVVPQTTISPNYQFLNKTYYWRAQARDIGDSQAVSPWSATQSFTVQPPAPPPPTGGVGSGWQSCGATANEALVRCVRAAVNPTGSGDLAFEVTKRVAWLLRGQGAGLLIKNSGENITPWRGYSFSISRICYPNGGIVKVVSDAGPGGGNGATWDTSLYYPNSVDPALYVAAINPDLP